MKKNPDKTIHAVVDRFEGGFIVVNFGRAGELVLSKKQLPDNIKEGDALSVEIITDEMATNRKKHLARAILQEILKK